MDGKEQPLKNAKLEGDHISFAVSESNPTLQEYSGQVKGNAIEGITKVGSGAEVKWAAIRGTAR